jgi:hypothetical protein
VPSYIELLTCLQVAREAKELASRGSAMPDRSARTGAKSP